jgi:two-component system sensor histidine kinase CpxA
LSGKRHIIFMRSLFLKIFLWFWAAMIMIGLALFLVVTTTLPDPLPAPWRESESNLLALHAASAVTMHEQGGSLLLAAYLAQEEAKTNYRMHLQLFDDKGNELSGRTPLWGRRRPSRNDLQDRGNRRNEAGNPNNAPNSNFPNGIAPDDITPGGSILPLEPPRTMGRNQAQSGETGAPPDDGFGQRRPGRGRGSRIPPETIQDVLRRTLQNGGPVFELAGPNVVAAQLVSTSTGNRYVLLKTLPRPWFGRPAADPTTQWLGLMVVLGTSGLVCYGLVRYLTAPMLSLRMATRQLAAGDLTARTGAAGRNRRDEVADLGRDFDAMAERIEALVVAQRRLLGDISHELRSPLARLSIGLALARRYASTGAAPEQIEAAFDRIKRETGRLNFLIEQLLQLTRLESGETGADKERVALDQLVSDIVADANFEAEGDPTGAKASVSITQSCTCYLTGSPDLLRSAVENVVRNAVRYTAPGTAVEVSLECQNDSVTDRTGSDRLTADRTSPDRVLPARVSIERNSSDRTSIERSAASPAPTIAIIRVRDHGPGVPEEALSSLFRPFYRVADARDRESGGVGLGLAITERAVASHGGQVLAANAEGGGLQIELQLPVTAVTPQPGDTTNASL